MAKNNGASPSASEMTVTPAAPLQEYSDKALAAFTQLYSDATKLEPVEQDLWKPTDKGELLRGVYLGVTFDNIVKQNTGEAVPLYNFLCRSDFNNGPCNRRVRGGVVLDRIMKDLPLHTIVEIEYMGEVPMKAGQQAMKDFKVFAHMPQAK